jgi:hypothetical protein
MRLLEHCLMRSYIGNKLKVSAILFEKIYIYLMRIEQHVNAPSALINSLIQSALTSTPR